MIVYLCSAYVHESNMQNILNRLPTMDASPETDGNGDFHRVSNPVVGSLFLGGLLWNHRLS